MQGTTSRIGNIRLRTIRAFWRLHFFLTCSLTIPRAALVEKVVRRNPHRFQPNARVFAEDYYLTDSPRLFNCVADTLDVKPSRWDVGEPTYYKPGLAAYQKAGKTYPELSSMGHVGLKKALVKHEGFERATLMSLLQDPGERKLALVVLRRTWKSRGFASASLHIYWLDGEGRWVSKPGEEPVELLTDEEMLSLRPTLVDGVAHGKVGLYWVHPSRSTSALASHEVACARAKDQERPKPVY